MSQQVLVCAMSRRARCAASAMSLLLALGVLIGAAGTAAGVPVTTAASDSFTRSVSEGLGSADTGGAWSVSPDPARFAVAQGKGQLRAAVRGGTQSATLPGYSSASTDLVATVSLDKRPAGGAAYVGITARTVAGAGQYLARAKVSPDGTVTLQALRSGTTLGAAVVKGLTYRAGTPLKIRLVVSGTSPTSVKAKTWIAGSAEPTDWQVHATDATAAMQKPGSIGVTTYASVAVTNAPITVSVDDVRAAPAAAAPASTVSKPGPSNTGVPAGTTLTRHNGDLVITTPGTVISGLDIHGFVKIKASNVTIKNSIVRGGAAGYPQGLITVSDGAAGAVIQDTEVVAERPSPNTDGIRGANLTARRVNVHGVIDAFHLYGNNVTIESSWLHGNLHYANDPNQGGGASHDDTIQVQIGSNIRVVGNTIEGAHNAGLMVTQDRGAVSNLRFVGNWADGGACTVNLAEKGVGPFAGLVLTDNTFGRRTAVKSCAILSPATTTALMTVGRNYFTDGLVVAVSRGV